MDDEPVYIEDEHPFSGLLEEEQTMIHIIEHDWDWRHGLSARKYTDAIVLHHAAIKTASAEDIHRAHLQRDGGTWAGIGYHIYVRKNGEVHEGRPLWASGAHVLNENYHTVGICVEGNYDVETAMPKAQLEAVASVLRYLKSVYPDAAIKCHKDMQATACPGRYYPLAEVLKYNAPDAPAESEDEEMAEPVYKDINDVPEWFRPAVQKLLDVDAINGGTPKNVSATDVNLTQTEARLCHLFVTYVDKVTGRVKEAL